MTPDVPRCGSLSPGVGLVCTRVANHRGHHRTDTDTEWPQLATADPSP